MEAHIDFWLALICVTLLVVATVTFRRIRQMQAELNALRDAAAQRDIDHAFELDAVLSRVVILETVKPADEPKRKQSPPISAPRWTETRDRLEGKPERGHSKPKPQETTQ